MPTTNVFNGSGQSYSVQCSIIRFNNILALISRCFPTELLSDPARVAAVLHGHQLHVDVLRGTALAHGPGRGVRQRRVRHAVVPRDWLGPARRAYGRVRLVEKLFRGHCAVSSASSVTPSS